jgi:DNA-directed RNA polymerase subunit M/transcription elongation factor TFIIS
MDCPRCGAPLTRYALEGREALGCDECGYIGVEVDHHVERREDETWADALARFERQRRDREADDVATQEREGEKSTEVVPAIVRVDEA